MQPTLAKRGRCAGDRPDTRPDGTDRSTSVPQPHTVAADVDDIVALIGAAAAGPFIVVAHSYGDWSPTCSPERTPTSSVRW